MSWFNFKKKSVLDGIHELTIKHYKQFSEGKLSDTEILEVVQTTMRAFKEASHSKNETIRGELLMNIATFMVIYRSNCNKKQWLEHLNNEIIYYLNNGLRETYINGLSFHHKFN